MKKYLAVPLTLTIASALFLLLAGPLYSYHTLWTAQSTQQNPPTDYENFNFYHWATNLNPSADDLWWWVQDSALQSDVSTVVQNWSSAIPQLTWMAGDQYTWDVKFKYGTCGDPLGVACTVFTTWYYDINKDANYWLKAEVKVVSGVNFSPSGRRGALAHEVGHLYGLDERYLHPPGYSYGCNNNSGNLEVMDGMITNQSGQVVHCDGLEGPDSSTDDWRATYYWSSGRFIYYGPLPANGGYAATWQLEDRAWAEYEHELHFYWWNGSKWVQYRWWDRIQDVGTEYEYEAKIINVTVDRRDYPVVTGPGWHVVCGWPWYLKFNTVGDWVCSDPIHLN